jgi:hypothetical protein
MYIAQNMYFRFTILYLLAEMVSFSREHGHKV